MTKNEIQEIIGRVQYKNWRFVVMEDNCTCGEPGRMWLQAQWLGEDTETRVMAVQKGRKWFLSPYMTESELVLTTLKAILTAEEHEARETFRYNGARIFHPHPNMDALQEIAEHVDRREEAEYAGPNFHRPGLDG